jgi:short subunit dehydrogenase-like uncharacterized protein
MSDSMMIYGATGYTGKLMVRRALDIGLHPVLGGRSESKLAVMAQHLGLEYRVAHLADPGRLDAALRGIHVVLHAAGPFSATWCPMVDACLRSGTHYLDITGEIRVIEALVQRDAEARKRKIMIMPAVGFDVVPSDCLVAHLARRLPGACRLALGLAGLRFMTRGSARTLLEAVDLGVVRRNGVITPVPLGSLQRRFDYGGGARLSLNISWGDVVTAYYTTGIPNIETYYEATPMVQAVLTAGRYFGWLLSSTPWQALLSALADIVPEGPTEEERASSKMVIVAEAADGRGRRVTSRLHTPEAYSLTGTTALTIARRALQGDSECGFQTPARVYGADFVLSLADVQREDVE